MKKSISAPDLSAYWMPYTANRDFKAAPRMLVSAQGMYYRDNAGNAILDGTAGLWCVPLGHAQPKIISAIQQSAATLDYAPSFQFGHPSAFKLAEHLKQYTGGRYTQVFYTNSGSDAVDTALKIALAYHRVRGDATRTRLIGRERDYHGVGFGGMSVGGIGGNRKTFHSALLPSVDYLPHTHDLEKNAFTKGAPAYGAHLADALERLVSLHDASNIAAVIVEPVAASAGVLIPPQGYLQRLRELCTKHGILLIFDEVITGFGRLGAPFAFDYFGVEPDLFSAAKGITNGAVALGAVFVRPHIYDAFMHGVDGIELFHGYACSGHPLACAAALATLDIFEQDNILEHAQSMLAYWQDAVHALRGLPHVIDIRTIGMIAGIELASIADKPGVRAHNALHRAFDAGILIRVTGDIIALSPPLVLEKKHIDELFGKLGQILKTLA